MTWGPYKRLKFAKKKATELRKYRVLTVDCFDDAVKDHGPSYVNVKLVEAPE